MQTDEHSNCAKDGLKVISNSNTVTFSVKCGHSKSKLKSQLQIILLSECLYFAADISSSLECFSKR